MKKLTIIFVFLFTACVSKHTVISKGYGNTKDEALSNAKSLAIEKATGVWISTEQRLSGDEFSKKTNQASSGSIESYKILGESENTVEIEAVVVYRKDNSVKMNSAFITNDDRERIREAAIRQEAKDKAIFEIGDIDKALVFEIDEFEIEPSRNSHYVKACGVIKFRDKWVDDFKDLGEPDLVMFRRHFYLDAHFIDNGVTVEIRKDITSSIKLDDLSLRHMDEFGREYVYSLNIKKSACFGFGNVNPANVDEFRFVFRTN